MKNRAIKNIRWILLFPLTFAVPMIVFSFFEEVPYFYNTHSLWYSILGLSPLVAGWFTPAFLTIPTACVIAPSHQKKISIIVLIIVALVWLLAWSMVFSPSEISLVGREFLRRSCIFHIVEICAQMLGLLAGFALVRFALKKHEKGEPFLKRSVIVTIAVVCIAAIPLCFSAKRDAGITFSDFTWQENAGIVSYSFTLENKSDKPNAAAVELIVVRGHSRNPGESIYTKEIQTAADASTEKTRVKIPLAPKETKQHSGQFALEATETGTFILVPRLTDPNSP